MTGDPYEEAAEPQPKGEARLVTPMPAKKNRKVVWAGLVLAGILLSLVIVAGIVGRLGGGSSTKPMPNPTTLTSRDSNDFAKQQAGEATYLKNQNTVLGEENDDYGEDPSAPPRTKAQNDAMRNQNKGSGEKSAAQQERERMALTALHRRENDLDSSPVALDFSEYFEREKEKEKQPAEDVGENTPATTKADSARTRRRSAIQDALNGEDDAEVSASAKKEAHDPKDDYTFDSSYGKLYRLMEDTVLETVLVNRLAGSAAGPVIVMITTDAYSQSRAHLLIPQGTRLLGSVTAVGSINQERLFVAFHRMIMPDGYSVSLDKFKGLDVVGQTGLRDLVNHHYIQIFGASLALAGIAATAQIGNNSAFGTYDWGTQMRSGISEEMGQSAQRILERFMNVLPTFTIRERARVKVMLANDLKLPDVRNHTMDPDL